jgi:hypothetical protein
MPMTFGSLVHEQGSVQRHIICCIFIHMPMTFGSLVHEQGSVQRHIICSGHRHNKALTKPGAG